MKSAEQVKAELEELEERKALEFNIIYVSKGERVYIQKNRITHFLFKDGQAPQPLHQNVLADFDEIERYKDSVRKSGILTYQREITDQKPGMPHLQLTIDGKRRTAVLAELEDAKLKKSIQGLIDGLKEISKTVQK